jgi:hypothetical protein
VPAFTSDQWVIVGLIFLLGLVLGMFLMAGGKWKRRYREEADLRREEIRKREALEVEHRRLVKNEGEMDTLRHAAARDEARRRGDEPGPL